MDEADLSSPLGSPSAVPPSFRKVNPAESATMPLSAVDEYAEVVPRDGRRDKNFEEALNHFRMGARLGDPDAMMSLVEMYTLKSDEFSCVF